MKINEAQDNQKCKTKQHKIFSEPENVIGFRKLFTETQAGINHHQKEDRVAQSNWPYNAVKSKVIVKTMPPYLCKILLHFSISKRSYIHWKCIGIRTHHFNEWSDFAVDYECSKVLCCPGKFLFTHDREYWIQFVVFSVNYQDGGCGECFSSMMKILMMLMIMMAEGYQQPLNEWVIWISVWSETEVKDQRFGQVCCKSKNLKLCAYLWNLIRSHK